MFYQILLTGYGPPVVNVELTEDEVLDLVTKSGTGALSRSGAAWVRPNEVRAIVPTDQVS